MSRTRIKTYDRIVEESLKLFNEQSERSITTNHIASHLGISPGNLYYHFRNKEEIVYQIYLQYRDFITRRLATPQGRSMTVDDLVHYLDTAFQAMWQYRFMFYDLTGLMARNPQLQTEYQHFVNAELQPMLAHHFREFIRLGLLKMEEEDIDSVTINIWLIVKFWFAFEQTAHPQSPITEQSGFRGVRQVLSLLKPYVQDNFMPAFNMLNQRYQTGQPAQD